jgi:TolA-binding protein
MQAQAEFESLAEQALQAEDQTLTLAAQVEDQAQALPDLEEALRQAQAKANEQRSSVVQVQQQIQVLAADQRNIEDQTRQLTLRREKLVADKMLWTPLMNSACLICKRNCASRGLVQRDQRPLGRIGNSNALA